jgi:hypothetical protein
VKCKRAFKLKQAACEKHYAINRHYDTFKPSMWQYINFGLFYYASYKIRLLDRLLAAMFCERTGFTRCCVCRFVDLGNNLWVRLVHVCSLLLFLFRYVQSVILGN